MKIIFLRGALPCDRDPKEILWDNIDSCDDIYTQMAFELTDEKTEVLYWGGKREFNPIPPFTEKYVKSIAKYKPDFEPDVIFARGGFEEYTPFLKRYPNAIKIYHGAGKRWQPKDGIKYDIVLCDTDAQHYQLNLNGHHPVLWSKPAASMFEDYDNSNVSKRYDICYIANGSQAKIKGIKWVYEAMPKGYSMLHLGNRGPYNAPEGTNHKRVVRRKMPRMISQCKMGILPYTSYDSAPRSLPEMLACGLPVVALDTVNFCRGANNRVIVTDRNNFWDEVRHLLNKVKVVDTREFYMEKSSLSFNVNMLRNLINEIRRRNRPI